VNLERDNGTSGCFAIRGEKRIVMPFALNDAPTSGIRGGKALPSNFCGQKINGTGKDPSLYGERAKGECFGFTGSWNRDSFERESFQGNERFAPRAWYPKVERKLSRDVGLLAPRKKQADPLPAAIARYLRYSSREKKVSFGFRYLEKVDPHRKMP